MSNYNLNQHIGGGEKLIELLNELKRGYNSELENFIIRKINGTTTLEEKVKGHNIRKASNPNSIEITTGKTALMIACEIENKNIIDALLEKGANVNLQDRDGNTALILEIKKDSPKEEIITALLEKGANINIINDDQKKIINIFWEKNKKNEVIVNLLLAHNFNFSSFLSESTILIEAIQNNLSITLITSLLEKKELYFDNSGRSFFYYINSDETYNFLYNWFHKNLYESKNYNIIIYYVDLLQYKFHSKKNEDIFFVKIYPIKSLSFCNFPLYYLFDHKINESIGGTIEQRTFLRERLNLDELFNLKTENIIDVGLSEHATILYKFEYKKNYYIYYSNSGLGIENQLLDESEKITACKIFKVNPDLYNKLIIDIQLIIDKVQNFNKNATCIWYRESKSYVDKVWDDYLSINQTLINKDDYNKIVTFILENMKYKEQYLCYALLNYACFKYEKDMHECTFNYLLNDKDNDQYTELINQIKSQDIKTLIENCYNGFNKNKYNEIIKIAKNEQETPFQDFINKINIKLNELENNTIKYKLKNSFKLKYDNITGLYNNIQQSGSCSFYSYYNLAINMLIFTTWTNEGSLEFKIDKIVNNFFTFHYLMIYTFCIVNDTTFKKSVENDLYNYSFIFRLIKENNLYNEILDFYKSKTFLLDADKLITDKLFYYKIQGNLYENKLFILNNFYIYEQLHVFLDNILNILRNNTPLKYDEIKHEIIVNIPRIFDEILENIKQQKTIIDENDISLLYFKGLKEIYILNLLLLTDSYKEKFNHTEQIYSCELNYIYFGIQIENINKIDISNDDTLKKKFGNYPELFKYRDDPLLIKLNHNEIINISIKTKELYDFSFSNGTIIPEVLRRYEYDIDKEIYYSFYYKKGQKYIPIPEDINFLLNFNTDDSLENYVNTLFKCYIKCLQKIKNIHIIDKDIYCNQCENISKYLLNYIYKKNIKKKIRESFKNNTSFTKLFFMITKNKYLIFDNIVFNSSNDNFIDLLKIITQDTNISLFTIMPNFDELVRLLIKYEGNLNDDSFSQIVNELLISYENLKWITNFGFIIPNHKDTPITYESNEYLNVNFTHHNYILGKLLFRFGIHSLDQKKYLFLFPKLDIPFYQINIHNDSPLKCFILIHEYEKCIQIGYNKDGSINLNECYLFDKTNKDHKNKLLFNLDKQHFPFISTIPSITPYLCYKINNDYYLEFILTSAFCSYYESEQIINYSKCLNPRKIDFNFFKMIKIKIAPSLIFPLIGSSDVDDYNLLFDFFDTNKPKIDESFLKNHIKFDYDFTYINDHIKGVTEFLCSKINCGYEIDKKFGESLNDELTKDSNREQVFKSFIDDNRLCNKFSCNKECINTKIPPIIDFIKMKIENTKLSIIKNNDESIFINSNYERFALLMELNILYDLLLSIKSENSCWDIQYILTSLKSILYFNEKIKENFYYGFELIFLLQNNFFFKENQMDRYKLILNNLITQNPNLELHQFMMGKGKTSVFTPLLAFATKYLTTKDPIVITIEHLVKPTIKLIKFTKQLLDIKINIFSDFEAKKRWIIHTDQNLKKQENIAHLVSELEKEKKKIINVINEKEKIKKIDDEILDLQTANLANEINIIDEFDTHHNYLQSMFNYVMNKELLNKEFFDYIFDFIIKKEDKTFIGNEEKKILNENLNYFYNQSKNMIYNQEYGFSILFDDNEKDNIWRLCTPFTRKDTPVKNSSFSSLLLTLILTFRTYVVQFKSILQDFDYENICNNIGIIEELKEFISINAYKQLKEKILFKDINKGETIQEIKGIFTTLYNDASINIKYKNNILKNYLYYVNKTKISVTKSQINMSFQDIIYNNYPNQWQIGYTGTTSLTLNKYPESDKFVFRKIIEDFDEKIEVVLALKGYSAPDDWKPKVYEINNINTTKNLETILSFLDKDKKRGFVDLAGLFLNNTNEDVSRILHSLLPDKRIIFFSNKDIGLEYNKDKMHTKHIDNDYDNFYYYDQCHTVGSDLRQPRVGHVAIIINRKTRWTDFAQAIFRFRKLNRGTYLSVIFIRDSLESPKTNEDIYLLLIKNEIKFNENQNDGIKYQLLKAMVRKESTNYLETSLKPEYLLGEKFNKKSILERLSDNIKNIDGQIQSGNEEIKKRYKELIDIDGIGNKEAPKLIQLVIGNGNENETNIDLEKEKEQEEEEEANIQKARHIYLPPDFYERVIDDLYIISHLNCIKCLHNNAEKLFNIDDITINNKQIYISYNLLKKIDAEDIEDIEYIINDSKIDNISRFCYIEFNDIILIETEIVSVDYYLHKLTVYNYIRELILPNMFDKNNIKNPLNLDIHPMFIKILGLKNYLNTVENDYKKLDINECILKINPFAFIILTNHIKFSNYRYDLSNELITHIERYNYTNKITLTIDKSPHNLEENNNLKNVYFDIYNCSLKLNRYGYDGQPPRINYKYITYINEYIFDDNCERLTKLNWVEIGKLGGFYKKYLKYKQKYLALKSAR